jgi:hypothetical protein
MPKLQQILCAHHKRRAPLLVLALLPCALALSGCSTALVRPEIYAVSAAAPVHHHAEANARRRHALLAPQAPPNCEFKGPDTDTDAVDKDLLIRLKLDYERHCYQDAEALVRNRLRELQASGLCDVHVVRRRPRFVRSAPNF